MRPTKTRSDFRLDQQPSARTISSKLEHEIKLIVGPEFRLPRLSGIPLPRRLLVSTYYDTVSHDLTHARITLRQRVEKGKQVWQLKIPLGHEREEIELTSRDAHPPLSFRELLLIHLDHRKLMPITTLRVWRSGVRIHQGRIPVADVLLDNVAVVKYDEVIQRFREVEIEQLDGHSAVLDELEQALRKAGARDHDGRPKLFRALSLPAPTSNQPPESNAPVIDHLKWALTQHVRWLTAHDPGTRLGLQAESLHQMRVATRRLRAVLRSAQAILVSAWAVSLERELAWLSDTLSQARDLDVQIAYFNGEASQVGVRDRKPLARFVAHLNVERKRVQHMVLSELKSARYLELLRRLQQAAQDPSALETAVTLRELARQDFKKLQKAIRCMGTSPKPAQLHQIRIKTKRARYAAELARWSVGKPALRFIKRARMVQDLLGTYQDSFTTELYIRAFLKQSSGVRAGFVAGRMTERQRQRRQAVLGQITPLLKSLLKRGRRAWG